MIISIVILVISYWSMVFSHWLVVNSYWLVEFRDPSTPLRSAQDDIARGIVSARMTSPHLS